MHWKDLTVQDRILYALLDLEIHKINFHMKYCMEKSPVYGKMPWPLAVSINYNLYLDGEKALFAHVFIE